MHELRLDAGLDTVWLSLFVAVLALTAGAGACMADPTRTHFSGTKGGVVFGIVTDYKMMQVLSTVLFKIMRFIWLKLVIAN